MPFSSANGKEYIRRIVRRVQPKTALDIGCGCGTYADMFPELEWTGIEIWEPYVQKYSLNEKYKSLIVGNACDVPISVGYDIAFAGDVLEHMPLLDAQDLLAKLRTVAATVVVSIPLGSYPQEAYEGNPHEKHVTDNWTKESFIEAFGDPDMFWQEGEIGIFAWSKTHTLRPKIAVYAISKNEEKFVERFCNSAKDADLILIADTGSTDGTVEVARSFGAVVYDIHIRPWRFDLARNAAMALIPGDVDICISLDLDEMMEPGWREEIERTWVLGETTNLWYLFDWGCGIRFPYRKIHSRHGYKWKHPCHEDLEIDPRVKEVKAGTNKLLVSHHPDSGKSRGQYMEILEAAVAEDDRDPTHFFYYSRELTFYQRWDEAIAALKRYLNMDAASNQNERCYAMRLLGKSYAEKGDPAEAEKWYLLAGGEAPNTREPWCELAMLMYRQHRWEECFAFSMRALRIKDKALVYTCDPAVWGHWPHDLASIAAWHLGMKDIAIEQAKICVKLSPDDERLKNNLRLLTADPSEKQEAA